VLFPVPSQPSMTMNIVPPRAHTCHTGTNYSELSAESLGGT
jgi:hypothetical protein